MSENFKKLKVSRNLLYFFAKKGELEEEMLEDAFQEAGIYPDNKQTAFFLDKLLLSIGAIFIVCGVIFFFAYNWAIIHKFIKLGILLAMLIGTGLFTLREEGNSYPRKIGLVVLCGLTGALFAQFGQIYQTGANAYDFFLGWTIIITAWVAVSRYPALWLFYLFLINLTLFLYSEQVRKIDIHLLFWFFVGLNGIVWLIWEYFHSSKSKLFSARFFPRIVGMFVIYCITLKVIYSTWESSPSISPIINWAIWVAMIIGIYFTYRNLVQDLLFLACGVISIMTIYCYFIFDTLRFRDIGGFLLAGISIVIVTFITVKYLVKLNKRWKQQSLYSEND